MWRHLSIQQLEAIAGKVGAAPTSFGLVLWCLWGTAAAHPALFWRAGKERTEEGLGASCRKEERLLLVVSAMLPGDRILSGPATAKGTDMLLKLFQVLLLTVTSTEGRLPCNPLLFLHLWCAGPWQPAFSRQVMPKILFAKHFHSIGLLWLLYPLKWQCGDFLMQPSHWELLCWAWRGSVFTALWFAGQRAHTANTAWGRTFTLLHHR